jgi:hypothetical protein
MVLWNMSCRRFNTPLRSMIFFFVQIIFFNVFMYAYISDNDNQVSKVLSNLLKITMNFWTVCIDHQLYRGRFDSNCGKKQGQCVWDADLKNEALKSLPHIFSKYSPPPSLKRGLRNLWMDPPKRVDSFVTRDD